MSDILAMAKEVLAKRDLDGSQSRDEHSEDCAYIHPHCLIDGLVKEIARLREERRWIPVGERLPDEPRRMLAFVPSVYGPQVAFVSNGKWQDGTEYSIGGRVTHWQPLPPGPEANG